MTICCDKNIPSPLQEYNSGSINRNANTDCLFNKNHDLMSGLFTHQLVDLWQVIVVQEDKYLLRMRNTFGRSLAALNLLTACPIKNKRVKEWPTMNIRSLAVLVLAAFLSVSGSAHATLFDRGGGLIYDDTLNITWLQDTTYGAGSRYDDGHANYDGAMTWENAMAWADNLTYFDSVRNTTYTDWRLPRVWFAPWAGGNCYGYNCVNSEMGSLYYSTLGRRGNPVNSLPSPDLFVNFANSGYWTSTIFWPLDGRSWMFSMAGGGQGAMTRDYNFLAWAVRDGDVASVPEPAPIGLLIFSLGVLAITRRQCRK